MLNLLVWVLGFGPGPFFGNSVHWYQLIFPGAHALRGQYVQVWLLLSGYLLVGIVLSQWARRPRRFRMYSK